MLRISKNNEKNKTGKGLSVRYMPRGTLYFYYFVVVYAFKAAQISSEMSECQYAQPA